MVKQTKRRTFTFVICMCFIVQCDVRHFLQKKVRDEMSNKVYASKTVCWQADIHVIYFFLEQPFYIA